MCMLSLLWRCGRWLQLAFIENLGLVQLNINEHLVLGLHHKQKSEKALA